MMVEKNLVKVGNSWGVIIPNEMLQEVGLKQSEKIRVLSRDGKIEIEPIVDKTEKVIQAASKYLKRYRIDFKKMAE
ncbi:MAG TPA: hypothetical protein DDW49_04155 [Deltaproteobacteria bacterium]|nr:hypothetical protein [Deltaproteobacteria bacterium]